MPAPSPYDNDGDELSVDLCLASASDAPVLVSAAPEHDLQVTRAIHGRSGRSAGGLIVVRCSDEPDGTAFENGVTLTSAAELAAGGTLLMRDIDRMGSAGQRDLLSRLVAPAHGESAGAQPVARIIAATSVNLYERVVSGAFSEDLFYRLNVLHLRLPLDEADWHFEFQDHTMDDALGRRRIVLDLPDGMTSPEPLPPQSRGRVLEFVQVEAPLPRPVAHDEMAARPMRSAQRAHREWFSGRVMRTLRTLEARLFAAVEHAVQTFRPRAGNRVAR